MKLLLVALGLLAASTANICHIYEQKLNSDNAIDINSVPEAVLMATDCDSCVALKDKGQLVVGCLKKGYTRQLLQTSIRPQCPDGHFDFKCNGDTCCCRGDFCFDQLRTHFSSVNPSQDSVCPVYRIPFDREGFLITEEVSKKERFIRQHCALCHSQRDVAGVEFQCIEAGDVNRNCESKKNFPGGALACDTDRGSCCCKGKTCENEYRLLYSKEDLPAPVIDQPYSGSAKNSGTFCTVLISLALLAGQ